MRYQIEHKADKWYSFFLSNSGRYISRREPERQSNQVHREECQSSHKNSWMGAGDKRAFKIDDWSDRKSFRWRFRLTTYLVFQAFIIISDTNYVIINLMFNCYSLDINSGKSYYIIICTLIFFIWFLEFRIYSVNNWNTGEGGGWNF